MRPSRVAAFGLLAVAAAQMFYYYPRLGDRIASHFNGAGVVNAHQTKAEFYLVWLVVLAVTTFVALGIPALIGVVPTAFINLPHKDYWLAPERRAETLARFAVHFEWFGVACLALIVVVMQSVAQANLSVNPRLDPVAMWIALGLYVAFAVAWLVRLAALFGRPPVLS